MTIVLFVLIVISLIMNIALCIRQKNFRSKAEDCITMLLEMSKRATDSITKVNDAINMVIQSEVDLMQEVETVKSLLDNRADILNIEEPLPRKLDNTGNEHFLDDLISD